MERWRGKTAAVTGAGSGIGSAITRALLSNGINVAGLDVDEEAITRILDQTPRDSSFGKFLPVRCDVSVENEIALAFDRMNNELGGIDIMVNNAGVINYGRIIESERATFERLVNINILGVATCTREAVRSMRSRNVEGHIFNINSVLGHEIPERAFCDTVGRNGYNLYPSCKHATVAMTHSIRREIAAAKLAIRITSVSPGLVKTNIARSAGVPEIFDNFDGLPPEDIAHAVIYALGTRPEVQVSIATLKPRKTSFTTFVKLRDDHESTYRSADYGNDDTPDGGILRFDFPRYFEAPADFLLSGPLYVMQQNEINETLGWRSPDNPIPNEGRSAS